MTKDLKYLYLDVLTYLSNYGIGVDTDISTVLGKYFFNIRVIDVRIYQERTVNIINILNLINTNGHIKYSYNTNANDLGSLHYKGGAFSVSMTREGFDYYYNNQLTNSTIKSLKNQILYNSITWGIALLAVSTTIYTIAQNTDLNKKVIDLNTQVQQLKSSQHSMVAIHKIPDTLKKTGLKK